MKNRIWIIIFSAVIVVCALIYFFTIGSFSNAQYVGIYQDNVLIEKINLDTLTDDRKITLIGEYGKNDILLSQGHIKMLSAQCPDQTCVKHEELKKGGTPIICLPNKIVIKWENTTEDYDAKTGWEN